MIIITIVLNSFIAQEKIMNEQKSYAVGYLCPADMPRKRGISAGLVL